MRRRRCGVRTFCAVVIFGVAIYGVLVLLKLDSFKEAHFANKVSRTSIHKMKLNTHSNTQQDQACVHPDLPLWNKDVNTHVTKTHPIKCAEEADWVYTANGKFYISSKATKKHGRIACGYVPVVNKKDVAMSLDAVTPIQNGSDLHSDAFKVSCKAIDGATYANAHACIAKTGQYKSVEKKRITGKHGMNVNVLMIGFDSVSCQSWKRLLPQTHAYFTEMIGGSVLEGYNIVGDGTPQALLPILTGKHERELPEVRRGSFGARPIDEVATFVWKRFEEQGYVTQWGEDMAEIGTFNLRMLGFKDQPTRHYMRPFYLTAYPVYPRFPPFCLGSRTRQQVFFDWIKEGLQTNKGKPSFTFGFFSEYSHRDINVLPLADTGTVEFLEFLLRGNYLDNTVLVMMSDHGARYGNVRATEQGKLEERMPYFGFRFPTWFGRKYKKEMENFKTNTRRLVTPFDIHETFMDILDHSTSPTIANVSRRGISLFNEIPKERTCTHAHIEPHWCACAQWRKVLPADPVIQSAARTVITLINNMTSPFSTLCHRLSLHRILTATTYITNDHMLQFKRSKDSDGRVPDLTDNLKAKERLFQVTFETTPGHGLFEATVRLLLSSGSFLANSNSISRLNVYGDAPKCIISPAPMLRPYCVCM